jgi:UDP:flavonoid glycosyltransferase YjiC (YdhE family)
LETESIVSLGAPGSVVMKKRGNCEIHSWLPKEQRDRFMRDSKIIIFSGGHGTCFETIKHAKPSICIPTQPEQMGNAKKLQELNCSISVKNQTELKSAIDEIENKAEFYKKNVKKLSDYSRKFNGIESTVNTVENIA